MDRLGNTFREAGIYNGVDNILYGQARMCYYHLVAEELWLNYNRTLYIPGNKGSMWIG